MKAAPMHIPHPTPSILFRITCLLAAFTCLFIGQHFQSAWGQTASSTPSNISNASSSLEQLFNGSDLDGWDHSGNWTVQDGVITRTEKGGSLVFKRYPVPDDFELQFEWKVAEGSNSGVYYRPGQYEYQILDNSRHADGKNPRTSAASLYFCMAPSRDVTRPVGQWNEAKIICQGTVVQHWLNGQKVVDFDYTDPAFSFNVELLRARGGDLTARGAFLSIQDHGDAVWYRNIRMRPLAENEALDDKRIQPEDIPAEVLAAEREKLENIVQRREQASKVKKKGTAK
jgi:hypothetical protein